MDFGPKFKSLAKDSRPIDINFNPQFALLRNGHSFDVMLEIPGIKRYSAHKLILGLSSEYFKALFAGRFKQSSTIVLDHVEPQTVDLYLDMIYGKEVILYDWREVLKLLVFAKFTLTDIGQDNIIKDIEVVSFDFVEYVRDLSALYDDAIPLDIIEGLKLYRTGFEVNGVIFNIEEINFSELGKEFVTALIETRGGDNIKYLIAQKAVKEGMSTELYGLVQMEKVSPSLRPSGSVRYLPNLLTPRPGQIHQGYTHEQLVDLRLV